MKGTNVMSNSCPNDTWVRHNNYGSICILWGKLVIFFFLQELVIFGWVNLDSKPYVDNGLYLPLLHEILKAISRNLSILIKMNYFQCIKNIFQENVSLVYIFYFN